MQPPKGQRDSYYEYTLDVGHFADRHDDRHYMAERDV